MFILDNINNGRFYEARYGFISEDKTIWNLSVVELGNLIKRNNLDSDVINQLSNLCLEKVYSSGEVNKNSFYLQLDARFNLVSFYYSDLEKVNLHDFVKDILAIFKKVLEFNVINDTETAVQISLLKYYKCIVYNIVPEITKLLLRQQSISKNSETQDFISSFEYFQQKYQITLYDYVNFLEVF